MKTDFTVDTSTFPCGTTNAIQNCQIWADGGNTQAISPSLPGLATAMSGPGVIRDPYLTHRAHFRSDHDDEVRPVCGNPDGASLSVHRNCPPVHPHELQQLTSNKQHQFAFSVKI
jgi:hypothetical protein